MKITIEYCPYDYQEDFHLSPARFRIISGGRRVGKSQVSLQEAIKASLEQPSQLVWWISPTYRDAKEVGWEEFLTLRDCLEPAIRTINHTNLYVEFTNGSKLYFKGSDNPDSLRGRGVNFVVMDEAAFSHQAAWKKAIRPALSDKQGKAILISSPNGRNWFHSQYVYASRADNESWAQFHWPSSYNPLLTEEDLQAAKDELSDVDYRQEYLAEFVTKAGMVYQDFGEHNVLRGFSPDPDLFDIYLGMDFGYANPTAVMFMAVEVTTGYVYQFDEVYVERTPMEGILGLIEARLFDHGLTLEHIDTTYTDPAGNADEISSGISPVDFLRDPKGAGLTVINRGSRIAPGLALVRSYIKTSSGIVRYYIDERCENTIRSLYGYTYKVGNNGIAIEEPDKDGIHDHACDALRYFFVNKFNSAKYVASKPNQVSYGTNSNRMKLAKQKLFKR